MLDAGTVGWSGLEDQQGSLPNQNGFEPTLGHKAGQMCSVWNRMS